MQKPAARLTAALIGIAALAAQAAPLDADLRNDASEPNNVLTYGMGYSAQRF